MFILKHPKFKSTIIFYAWATKYIIKNYWEKKLTTFILIFEFVFLFKAELDV